MYQVQARNVGSESEPDWAQIPLSPVDYYSNDPVTILKSNSLIWRMRRTFIFKQQRFAWLRYLLTDPFPPRKNEHKLRGFIMSEYASPHHQWIDVYYAVPSIRCIVWSTNEELPCCISMLLLCVGFRGTQISLTKIFIYLLLYSAFSFMTAHAKGSHSICANFCKLARSSSSCEHDTHANMHHSLATRRQPQITKRKQLVSTSAWPKSIVPEKQWICNIQIEEAASLPR